MAINNIPGVGPSNADIAATIATTPAVSAQITASVPSTSAIATAVGAPSLAQITSAITSNAASAGVTMAAITSSITANAASAGVTLAAIGTQVANNANPFPNYTSIANTNWDGNTTITIGGLSSYKRLYVYYTFTPNSTNDLTFRFNGDSGNNYYQVYQQDGAGGGSNTTNRIVIGYSAATTQTAAGYFVIDNVSSTTAPKFFNGWARTTGNGLWQMNGVYNSNSAISSLSVSSPGNVTNSKIFVLGV